MQTLILLRSFYRLADDLRSTGLTHLVPEIRRPDPNGDEATQVRNAIDDGVAILSVARRKAGEWVEDQYIHPYIVPMRAMVENLRAALAGLEEAALRRAAEAAKVKAEAHAKADAQEAHAAMLTRIRDAELAAASDAQSTKFSTKKRS